MAPWRRIGLHTIISNKTTELPLGRSVVSLLRSHLQSEQIINSESVKKSENIFIGAVKIYVQIYLQAPAE